MPPPQTPSGAPRPELERVLAARAALLDAQRPDAVARQHGRGRLTVREAVARLADPDSFVEYGGLARPAVPGMEGAADGLVMGTARVDGRPVDLVLYDYTVHGGTQSATNHRKISRMFEHALRHRLPVILWLEGGGARTHDMRVIARGSTTTFVTFARLSGLVPTIGIVPSRAFAGQANLAGLSDLLIAVRDSAMGLGGPPLVEAALGPMRDLRDRTRETVQLGVRLDRGGVVVSQVEGLEPLRIAVDVGLQFAFHDNAPGKLLLAWLPEQERQETIRRLELPQSTDRTITDRAELARECVRIRGCGYAVDHAEADPGIHCVAAPIPRQDGGCVGTVWISAPARRMPKGAFRDQGRLAIEAGLAIARGLGGGE